MIKMTVFEVTPVKETPDQILFRILSGEGVKETVKKEAFSINGKTRAECFKTFDKITLPFEDFDVEFSIV